MMFERSESPGPRSPHLARAGLVSAVVLALAATLTQALALPRPAGATTPECAAEQPDDASAAAMAQACGTPVEDLSARTERDQIFANPSGTRTLVSAAVPQRVKRADGTWTGIDPTLHVDVDGSLVPQAPLADVRFSGGGRAPLVTWREGASTFTVSWPSPLPTPRVEQDTAVYPDVLPDVDLRVTATTSGYAHSLVLKSAQAAANPAVRSVHYVLGGDLAAQVGTDGGLVLVNATGAVLATTGAGSAWDSSVNPAAAGELLPSALSTATALSAEAGNAEVLPADLVSDARRPGAAAQSVSVDVALSGGDLVVSPNPALLSDPSAIFPIFVDPPLNNLRSKWAYANTINSNWAVGNRAWVGRNSFDGTLYRSYFEFDVSAIRGTQILAAQITMVLDHSWSCSPTWVHLYRTGSITVASGGRMSWSTRPLGSAAHWLDAWEGNANEAGGCGVIQPDVTAVFDGSGVRSDVQTGATANWTLYTVGLCACNSSDQYESTQDRWKKFYTDKTYLIATYDKPPNAPAAQALSTATDCYLACVSPSEVRTTQPTLIAGVSDPYNGMMRTVFEVRDAASGTATLIASNSAAPVTTAAPGTASWKVTSGALVNGTTYYWRARSTDENNLVGAWSSWQTLTVDTSPPPMSPVTSSQYPLAQWGAQVNTQGTFGLSGPADVNEFTWWVDAGASTTITAGGTSPRTGTVTYTPTTDMVHTLHVKAKDRAGNTGATYDHQFWVSPVLNKYSTWQMNEVSGTSAADSGSGGSALSPGTLSGGVTWTSDTANPPRDHFVTFAGSGQITTATPVLDTTKTFTVAAWVRFTDLVAGDYQTVLSQAGTNTSRFQLQYRKDANGGAGGFCFTMHAADVSGTSPTTACAAPVNWPVTEGEWVHLAGVYDSGAGKIRVYVMGDLFSCGGDVAETAFSGTWSATGAFVIGRSNNGTGGTAADWLTGDVDNVYAYQRALADSEICQLALQ